MTPSPSAITIVASNRRLSGQLRRQHERAMRHGAVPVWESPNILPREAWTRRLWSELAAREPLETPVLLSRVQEETLWCRAIQASGESSELLDLTATASAAARAWESLHAWKLPLVERDFSETAETQAFFAWATFVQDTLREQGSITASQLPAALVERGALPTSGITYAGFQEIAPRERELFAACRASGHAAPAAKSSIFYQSAQPDESAEWQRAALWARQKLEEKSGVSIGIIVPALAQRRAALERIFDDILNPTLDFAPRESRPAFHISAGSPSHENPLIATALSVLGLEQGLTLAEAGALLRSPFLKWNRTAGAKLDAQLRRHRVATVYLEDLREHLSQWTRHSREPLPPSRTPSEWAGIFSKLVTGSGWPGERTPTRAERRTIEHWKNLLSALASLDCQLPEISFTGISFNEAFGHLRRITHQTRLHVEDSDDADDAPIQLLDLDEAAGALPGLEFDALWISGMHASAWPAPARSNPFLPLEMQRAAGVSRSSPELELARARRVTKGLLASAGEIVCSYPEMVGEEKQRPSSLIEKHFEKITFPPLDAAAAVTETMPERIARLAPPLEPGSAEAPAFPSGNTSAGGATLLQDQAACPFRAFAKYRLGARELEEPEIGVSPRERGGAVHEALEWIWQELKTQQALLQCSPAELDALIEAAAAHGLKKNHAPERFRRLEHARLVALLKRWMDLEKRRRPFTVAEKETGRQAPLGGLILNIRPDRMDLYEDQTYAVIDYKTSKLLRIEDWDGERPAAPQLPLYAIKAERKISEVMFAKLTALKVESLSRTGPALEKSMTEWQRVLETLAQNYVAGHAAVDPLNGRKTCEYCKLPALCRVSELGYPQTDEAEDSGE